MDPNDPRILAVAPSGASQVDVRWSGRADVARIDLAGWIATGGDILAPLRAPEVFATVRDGDHGGALIWGEDDGDLAIDAVHLHLIETEQRPFLSTDLVGWQHAVGLSNQEAADLIGVVPSTWSAYKAGANIPTSVALLCRAALRDPLILQAHYRPRRTGRPAMPRSPRPGAFRKGA